jgi:hypothetical protein
VRVVDGIDALRRDRDYKLIETSSPKQFELNLAAE